MKKIFTLMMMATLMASPVMAQEEVDPSTITEQSVTGLRHYKFGDNWYISAFFGGNFAMSENTRSQAFKKNVGPDYALAIGKWLNPAIGLRVKADYMIMSSRANKEAVAAYPSVYTNDGKYRFRMFTAMGDLMLNLNNILGQYKESTRFNVYAFMGVGFTRNSKFDKHVEAWGKLTNGAFPINTKTRSYLAGHIGLGTAIQLSQALDFNLEAAISATNDKYNGAQYDVLYDGFVTAQAGLTYHFKDHFGDRRFKYRTLNDADILGSLNDKINAARQDLANARPRTENRVEETYNKIEVLDMTVNFIIDKYNITKLQKKNIAAVAKYMEDNPDVNLTVTGFADVKTAYPAYNLKLSERRAKAVYNCLVKEFGVDPSRLKIDYKGDTIQPYELKNEWNRVVIFVLDRNK